MISQFRSNINEFKTYIFRNKAKLFYFEIIYILFFIIFILPSILLIYNLSIKLAGYSVLTSDNFLRYLIKPFSIPSLLIEGVLITYFVIFQIAGLCIIFDFRTEKTSIKNIIYTTFVKTNEFFKLKNLGLFAVFCLIIPLFIFVVLGYKTFSITSVLWGFIPKNNIIRIILGFVFIYLLFLFFLRIFVFHFRILEKDNGFKCTQKSTLIVKKNFYEILVQLLRTNFVIFLVVIFLYFIIMLILGLLIKVFVSATTSLTVFLSFMYAVFVIGKVIVLFAVIIINVALLTRFYNRFYPEHDELEIFSPKLKIYNIKAKTIRISFIVFTAVVFLTSGVIFFVFSYTGKIRIVRSNSDVEVVAHRGSSTMMPENSLSAFKLAEDEYADTIELDIQLTVDKEVVVFHDATMARVSSCKKKISEMTLEEIKQIDIGSYVNASFSSERVPTLAEVFELVKHSDISILIEFKTHVSSDEYFNEICLLTDEIIDEYDFRKRVSFCSFSDTPLIKMKEIDNDYIVGSLFSSTPSSYDKKFDFISVNYNFIDLKVVSNAHKKGLKIYAWTVNSNERVIKLLNIGIDGIITDGPADVKKIVYVKRSDIITQQVFSWFFDQDEGLYDLLKS